MICKYWVPRGGSVWELCLFTDSKFGGVLGRAVRNQNGWRGYARNLSSGTFEDLGSHIELQDVKDAIEQAHTSWRERASSATVRDLSKIVPKE